MQTPADPTGSLGAGELAFLHEAVDASDFSLGDWTAALGAFVTWLESRGESRRPWAEMIGYIECCTRMTAPGLGTPDLAAWVTRALEDYGFSVLAELQD